MVINPKDMKVEEITNLRGGDGTLVKTTMAPAFPDMHQRLFGRFCLPKGSSIGMHQHENEVEYYYILSGQGVVTEDDVQTVVNPGDLIITGWGHSHSIRNEKDKNLEFVAVINTEK